jgi:putative transposase
MPSSSFPALSKKDDQELRAIVRKRTNGQRLVERAKIILLASQRVNILQSAWQLGLSRNTVKLWRSRWTERVGLPVEQRLSDAPRSGAPARISPEEICRIIALSCEPPKKFGRPITHWTQQELADEAMKQGIVELVSQRSVGRFLKSGRYSPSSQPLLADAKAR